MNKAKWPGWELPHDSLEIKRSKDHKIISQQPRHYFDKWTLSLSLAGHTRQIHIIIRRNHWLTVHRLHIDQTAQSSSSACQSKTVTPGICLWESTALRARHSATFGTTHFCPDTYTQCGSLREPLLSTITISRVVCLHLKLIGSHLHNDLLANWPCRLVSAVSSPCGTLLWWKHGRHLAQNPQTQHLNLFPLRNRLLLNAQKWLDIKETETAGIGGGQVTWYEDLSQRIASAEVLKCIAQTLEVGIIPLLQHCLFSYQIKRLDTNCESAGGYEQYTAALVLYCIQLLANKTYCK